MGNGSENIKRWETARPGNRVAEGKEVNPSKKVIAVVKRGGEYERRALLPLFHGRVSPHPANEGLVVMVRISRILVPPFFSGSPRTPVGAGVEDVLHARAGLFRRFFCGRISCHISVFVRMQNTPSLANVAPLQISMIIVFHIPVFMPYVRISIRIFDKRVRGEPRNGLIGKGSVATVQCNAASSPWFQISAKTFGPNPPGVFHFVLVKVRYAFSFHSMPLSILVFMFVTKNT